MDFFASNCCSRLVSDLTFARKQRGITFIQTHVLIRQNYLNSKSAIRTKAVRQCALLTGVLK